MGKLPLTFAGPGGVPSVPMARDIGPKMNIHAQDAMFEAGIREAGQLGAAGDALGDAMGNIGAEVREYVQKQKAKEDKQKYLEAMDLINEDYETNFQQDALEKATDPDTGKVIWPKYGQFFEGDKTAYMQNAFAQVQANDEVRGMVEKTVNGEWGSSRKLSHVKFRVGAQQEQTNEYYTTKVAQAIQAQDAPTAIAMIKLRAEGSPEWQLSMDQDIRNASSAVWNNQQKTAIQQDPYNYDPSKMTDEEFPDYIVDKDDARKKLSLHRNSILRQVKVQDGERTSAKLEELNSLLLKGDLGYEHVEEARKEKNSDGTPVLSAKAAIQLNANIKAAAEGKKLDYDKVAFEQLRKDVYNLDKNDPDYKIKKAALDNRKTTFPVTQMQMIDSDFKKNQASRDNFAKMGPIQREDRSNLFKDAVEGFFPEEEADRLFAVWDSEEYTPWNYFWTGETKFEDKISAEKNMQALSNIQKLFDAWTKDNPQWTMEEGQKQMKILKEPYAKDAYRREVLGIQQVKDNFINEENLKFTAEKYGITVEEVKQRLRDK